MVRLVSTGERAGICGVSPAEDSKVPDADCTGDEALQQCALSGLQPFLLSYVMIVESGADKSMVVINLPDDFSCFHSHSPAFSDCGHKKADEDSWIRITAKKRILRRNQKTKRKKKQA